MAETPRRHLRSIPSVAALLDDPGARALLARFPRQLVVDAVRARLDELRAADIAGDLSRGAILAAVARRLDALGEPAPRPVINASGVVLHTNLGRAMLATSAVEALRAAAAAPCALEMNLTDGSRGHRDDDCASQLVALTGAEAAAVVNNNAAAVILAVNSLAEGREVVVSRGELIEIGGSFRIPEILAKSGVRLREVGTTNRTHLRDYADAIGPQTGLLLKVHPSNYAIGGFTAAVSLAELAELGAARGVPVVEDLGSGALVDLAAYGLPAEPLVADSVAAGADAVTFSGDKLLGGPQAGLIVGRRDAVERMNANPLKRALRCDKLTLAALAATLRLYRTSTSLPSELPTLRYLTRDPAAIAATAAAAAAAIAEHLGPPFAITVEPCESQIGSGAQPTATLPSRAVVVSHPRLSPLAIAAYFRSATPPIIGRVHADRFWLDARCIDDPTDLVPLAPHSSILAPATP